MHVLIIQRRLPDAHLMLRCQLYQITPCVVMLGHSPGWKELDSMQSLRCTEI
jgi:hypothetical protein